MMAVAKHALYGWVLLWIGLWIAGCAPSRLQPLETDFVPDRETNQGYVLASVTSNGGRSAQFHIRQVWDGVMRPLESRGTGLFELSDDLADGSQSNEAQRGRLMLVAMPVGEYQLVNWSLLLFRREHDGKRLSPAQLPPIPFSVRAGEVVYLGNLHVTVTHGGDPQTLPKALLPIAAASARIADRSARDVALMAQRYPQFLNLPLRLSVKSRPEWDLTIRHRRQSEN